MDQDRIPEGISEDPGVHLEEWLGEIAKDKPGVTFFRVRLRWLRGTPLLVWSPNPPPAGLFRDVDPEKSLMIGKILAGQIWAKLVGDDPELRIPEGRIEIEDPDGALWGYVLGQPDGSLDLFDATGAQLGSWRGRAEAPEEGKEG